MKPNNNNVANYYAYWSCSYHINFKMLANVSCNSITVSLFSGTLLIILSTTFSNCVAAEDFLQWNISNCETFRNSFPIEKTSVNVLCHPLVQGLYVDDTGNTSVSLKMRGNAFCHQPVSKLFQSLQEI